MFNPEMKKYILYKPVVTVNEYNEEVLSYEYDREIDMAIALNTHTPYTANDSNITNLNLIGLTRDRYVNKGDMIDNYYVEFVEVNRRYSIITLREIDNYGRHNN